MEILQLLLESASDINNRNLLGETPLLAGARSGAKLEMLEVLAGAGADASSPDTISHETALMEAACRGDADLCRLLLNHRADAAARNIHGCTAWDLAIENRHSHQTMSSEFFFGPLFCQNSDMHSKVALWQFGTAEVWRFGTRLLRFLPRFGRVGGCKQSPLQFYVASHLWSHSRVLLAAQQYLLPAMLLRGSVFVSHVKCLLLTLAYTVQPQHFLLP